MVKFNKKNTNNSFLLVDSLGAEDILVITA